jgi:hypothetical protein
MEAPLNKLGKISGLTGNISTTQHFSSLARGGANVNGCVNSFHWGGAKVGHLVVRLGA